MTTTNVTENRTRPRLRMTTGYSLVLSCLVWAAPDQQRSASATQLTSPFEPLLVHIVDANGNAPSDPDSLLYRKGTSPLSPILSPDGEQLTFGQFTNVNGAAHIERVADGTSVIIEVTGLIPDGVYTAWSNYYQAPGFTPNQANRIGFGALGPNDGSGNSFIADASGKASLGPVIQPPGPLSETGVAPQYVLDGNVQSFAVSLGYHLDGQTYGGLPGPASQFAVQSVAVFVPEPSSIALGLLAAACFFLFRRSIRGVSFYRPSQLLQDQFVS